MLKRSLFLVALACGCSPAVAPATSRAPSSPLDVARSTPLDRAATTARYAHHARHLARLAPPFAASSVTRRVPDSEPMTALVVAP